MNEIKIDGDGILRLELEKLLSLARKNNLGFAFNYIKIKAEELCGGGKSGSRMGSPGLDGSGEVDATADGGMPELRGIADKLSKMFNAPDYPKQGGPVEAIKLLNRALDILGEGSCR